LIFPKIPYWILLFCLQNIVWADAIIADHACRNIKVIPFSAIQDAKDKLIIAYGHTSHGTQIWYGMVEMNNFINNGGLGISAPQNFYAVNLTGEGDALELRDTPFTGALDLGNPDRVAWATATRNYLKDHPEVNVVMWAWCYQVDSATAADINLYINQMEQLIADYPKVQFVYMTGHLYGTREGGNLNVRNNQIRDHCRTAGRILYDFADIESYDPEALVNYMPLACDDACNYDSDGDGVRERNWAYEWELSHVEGIDWYMCSSMHSYPLNSNMKAYAAWWLWARLAGWNGCSAVLGDMNGDCRIDVADFVIFSDSWLSDETESNWNFFADIAPSGGDGVVNIQDLNLLSQRWLYTHCGAYFTGDFNQDCYVGWDDLILLAAAWLSEPGQPEWNIHCDIMPAGGDEKIDFLDFTGLSMDWLKQ
jgi:hypothetical protein